MTPPEIAGDHRRATSLVVHYGLRNDEGINVITAEAMELERVGPLILAVCTLHQQIVPTLLSESGQVCLEAMITELAEVDEDPAMARVGRLIVAHDHGDTDAFDAVLIEARDTDTVTELVVGLLSAWSVMCPMLYSKAGLSTLRKNVAMWAALESA